MVKFANVVIKQEHEFRLTDFNVYNSVTSFPNTGNDLDDEDQAEEDDEPKEFKHQEFKIQMFGLNEMGETYSVVVENFKPFFYVNVPNNWNVDKKMEFINHIKKTVSPFYSNTINVPGCKIIKRHKFYGFDAKAEHKFLKLEFINTAGFNQVKNLWYTRVPDTEGRNASGFTMKLTRGGYKYRGVPLQLYESNIPTLLRFFHIMHISPSGWVRIATDKTTYRGSKHFTSCDHEFCIDYKDVEALPDKDVTVPYKLASFDIEASSSHGDFPIPVKSYYKLAQNVAEHFEILISKSKAKLTFDTAFYKTEMLRILLHAFGLEERTEYANTIARVYPKAVVGDITVDQVRKWYAKIVAIGGDLGRRNMDALHGNHLTSIYKYFTEGQAVARGASEDVDGGTDTEAEAAGFDYEEMTDLDPTDADDPEAFGGLLSTLPQQPITWKIEEVTCDNDDDSMTSGSLLLAICSELGALFDGNEATAAQRTRKELIEELDKLFMTYLPPLEGDKVTFIGTTFMRHGQKDPEFNHCIVLRDCEPLADMSNSVVETYDTEAEVLLAWTALIQRENPDLIWGYNNKGFDYEFMFHRAIENECIADWLKLSRNRGEICNAGPPHGGNRGGGQTTYKLTETTVSLAGNDFILKYPVIPGRLQTDLYMHFRRNFNYDSYKLDHVASDKLGDRIKKLTTDCPVSGTTTIKTGTMLGLNVDSYIHISEVGATTEYYADGEKYRVTAINFAEGEFVIEGTPTPNFAAKTVMWGLAKDDVTPQDIFRMSNGTAADRAVIAKYCLQDCNLVHYLANKIDLITDYIEMATICSVPINFLIMRGQGIKLFSLLANYCRENQTLIPVIDKSMDGGYEGAIVIDPKCRIYTNKPMAVNDFNSLYPSSCISENISHDTKVWTKEYDLDGKLLRDMGERFTNPKTGKTEYVYDNLPAYDYVDITYDTYKWVRDPAKPKAKAKKVKCGYKVCRYAYAADGTAGILPALLKKLLAARKVAKNEMAALIESDPYNPRIANLNMRQNNLKLSANSVYGNAGASTSMFCDKDVAASITAVGRMNITYAKRIVEECYGGGLVCPTTHPMYPTVQTYAECIYGDTDSLFYIFNLKDVEGRDIIGKDALAITIELAEQVGELASAFLKQPHNWEYEKTFDPLILISKKKYSGLLYEHDINKCKRKDMGNVQRRRDNAPIVKDVFSGVIDIIFNQSNIMAAIDFLKVKLQEVVDERVPMGKLIITKKLRSGYAKPLSIAHKVLADRIGEREPGNGPKPGDRIDFVYIQTAASTKSKKAAAKVLQGDRIETPGFITKHGLKIDYSYYITNQIMNPTAQIFALALEDIWERQGKRFQLRAYQRDVCALQTRANKEKWAKDKLDEKIEDLRISKIQELLFDHFIRILQNRATGAQDITSFFGRASASAVEV